MLHKVLYGMCERLIISEEKLVKKEQECEIEWLIKETTGLSGREETFMLKLNNARLENVLKFMGASLNAFVELYVKNEI